MVKVRLTKRAQRARFREEPSDGEWVTRPGQTARRTPARATEPRRETPRPYFLYIFHLKCLHMSLDLPTVSAEPVPSSASPWPSRWPAPAHHQRVCRVCRCWKDRLETQRLAGGRRKGLAEAVRLLRGRGARGCSRRPWGPAEAIFCLAVRLESKSGFPSLLHPLCLIS